MEKRTETIRKENVLIRNKVLKGLKESYRKLVIKNKLEDGELVLSIKGKIKNVKARRIKVL
jgi:hypothetical protein